MLQLINNRYAIRFGREMHNTHVVGAFGVINSQNMMYDDIRILILCWLDNRYRYGGLKVSVSVHYWFLHA